MPDAGADVIGRLVGRLHSGCFLGVSDGALGRGFPVSLSTLFFFFFQHGVARLCSGFLSVTPFKLEFQKDFAQLFPLVNSFLLCLILSFRRRFVLEA